VMMNIEEGYCKAGGHIHRWRRFQLRYYHHHHQKLTSLPLSQSGRVVHPQPAFLKVLPLPLPPPHVSVPIHRAAEKTEQDKTPCSLLSLFLIAGEQAGRLSNMVNCSVLSTSTLMRSSHVTNFELRAQCVSTSIMSCHMSYCYFYSTLSKTSLCLWK
jgi:hypothetical protein